MLVFLLAFFWPIFPITGAYTIGAQPSLTPGFIVDVLHHAVLPALSIVLVSLGWWFLSMRSLIVSVKGEDFMTWAEAKGLPQRRIFWGYAFRNALLPQAARSRAEPGPHRRRRTGDRDDLRLSGSL
jgi:peptide/nickel transport system permease protein